MTNHYASSDVDHHEAQGDDAVQECYYCEAVAFHTVLGPDDRSNVSVCSFCRDADEADREARERGDRLDIELNDDRGYQG